MLKKYSISLIVAIVLITPITVFAIVNWFERQGRQLPVFEGDRFTITDFHLTNQEGASISQSQWKNKIVVANFFFTHCPVICPKMTHNLKNVQAAFPVEKNLLFTSFSVDPERDSVAELRAFAERFGITGNWHLLTGEKQVIYGLARNSFSVSVTGSEGGEHDFIHSEKLVLIDRHQKIRGFYNGTSEHSTQQLIQDIKKLQDEK